MAGLNPTDSLPGEGGRQYGNRTSHRNKDNRNNNGRQESSINDIVHSQEEATQILRDIYKRMDGLRSGGSSIGNIFGGGDSEDDSSGVGSLVEGAVERGVGSSLSNSSGGGGRLMSMLSSLTSNSSSSARGMGMLSGQGGQAGGGVMMGLQIANQVLAAMRGIMSSINDTIEGGISESVNNQKKYLGPISARLQDFNDSAVAAYKEISHNIRNTFTNNRFLDQQKLLENIADLIREGVGYNYEDRAFLATIAEKTVSTFEILDANLNRMIRLQQTDLSRAQFGSEGALTKFLNTYFQDTSYLNNLYDSTVGQLMEAASQLTNEQTTSYLYNVQKWLASLYAVGISDNAINQIVQGLNYLGSGNVSQLTGNNQLNTLFAMSAQKAGISYANLLTYGVTDTEVDKLLKSMVEYLQSIANNTSNEVLRSEYGRIFGGLSVSDLRAIQNLTEKDIKNILGSTITFDKAVEESIYQANRVEGRTSVAEQIENMYNNFVYSIGAEIGESEDAYTAWYVSNLVQDMTDALGEAVPGLIGELIGNLGGVVTEGIKLSKVGEALHNLEMFNPISFSDALEIGINSALTDGKFDFNDVSASAASIMKFFGENKIGQALDAFLFGGKFATTYAIADASYVIGNGVANWDTFSRAGFNGGVPFEASTGTERMGNYSSSISLKDNAFNTQEAQIKQEEITGFDEAISESVDAMYEKLFGNDKQPIMVVMTDADGNVIDRDREAQRISDRESLEQYSGRTIMSQAYWVAGLE